MKFGGSILESSARSIVERSVCWYNVVSQTPPTEFKLSQWILSYAPFSNSYLSIHSYLLYTNLG